MARYDPNTDDEIAGLSFDDKSNWLERNPVTAARHFQYRLNALFQGFLCLNPLLSHLVKLLTMLSELSFKLEVPHMHTVSFGSKMLQSTLSPLTAKLMLYYPWFNEQTDLLGGHPSYEAHYRHVTDTVLTNESR